MELHFSGLTKLTRHLGCLHCETRAPDLQPFLVLPLDSRAAWSTAQFLLRALGADSVKPINQIVIFILKKKQSYRPETYWRLYLKQSLGFHTVWAVYEDIFIQVQIQHTSTSTDNPQVSPENISHDLNLMLDRHECFRNSKLWEWN